MWKSMEVLMGRKRKTHREFVGEMEKMNPNIEIVGEYNGFMTKIKCRCLVCNDEWDTTPRILLRGAGCPKCAGNKKKTHKEFVEQTKSINPNITIIGEYTGAMDKIECKCTLCGGIWSARTSSLLSYSGCPYCARKNRSGRTREKGLIHRSRKTHEEFIKQMNQVNPNIEILGKYEGVNKSIECRCSICGKKWNSTPSYLLRGRGCSCYKKNKIKIGTKFGRWTVIGDEFKMNDRLYCRCVCECGVEKNVNKTNLTSGKSRSCGCLTHERASTANTIDLTGQKFGNLTVVKRSSDTLGRSDEAIWECLCDCGNVVNVRGYSLRTGNTKSCGCIVSRGEEEVGAWLKEHNFNYAQQYTFDDCVYKGKLKFDFAILDEQSNPKVLIEYDGKQHYVPFGYMSDTNLFDIAQTRDKIKNKYCKDNNIKLLRIPYWDFKNIGEILSKELGLVV